MNLRFFFVDVLQEIDTPYICNVYLFQPTLLFVASLRCCETKVEVKKIILFQFVRLFVSNRFVSFLVRGLMRKVESISSTGWLTQNFEKFCKVAEQSGYWIRSRYYLCHATAYFVLLGSAISNFVDLTSRVWEKVGRVFRLFTNILKCGERLERRFFCSRTTSEPRNSRKSSSVFDVRTNPKNRSRSISALFLRARQTFDVKTNNNLFV